MALRPRQVTPELLNKVTKALGITSLDQWYYVSQTAVARAIGSDHTLNNYGGTSGFLKSAYPNHQFDEEKLKLTSNQEKDQKFLEVIIRKLFPNEEIQTKARKSVGIINPETDAYLEIDFWIPTLKLGIEYQDKHHFEYQWYANGSLEDYKKRDNIKKDVMAKLGYTLVTIGCWWDKSLDSVAATIRKYRPDLLIDYESVSAEPIPSYPPPSYFGASSPIPGVTALMNPFIPGSDFNPTNWYVGEKHDGIRGVYNSVLNTIFSRSGNELSVLPSLLNDIPNMLVEGEIIAGRGNYSRIATVSNHSHHDKVNWPLFRYVLFDIPDSGRGNYVQRYSAIINGLWASPFIFAQSAFRVLIRNKAHLKMLMDAIIGDAGEGVIAQQDAQYEYGRAKTLAKMKVRRDADAQVLNISGFYCTCKLVNGVTADIEFSGDFDTSKLKVGDIISFYHNGFSERGTPRQAEIYKVRYDVLWDSLISEQAENSTKRRSVKEAIGSRSLNEQVLVKNKMGHWTKSINVRSFFDEFAKASEFDPLVAENWYPITFRELQRAGGGSLLNANNFSLKKALSRAYPELKFEDKNFRSLDKKEYWSKTQNAREFFDNFAQATGFDPLVPDNWYTVKIKAIRYAGGGSLLNAFGYSTSKALSCAYPELKFDQESFRTHNIIRARNKSGYWNKPENVRAFFDEFARTLGFDPLVPEQWYSISTRAIQQAGGSGLFYAYSFDLHKALAHAYPELKFEEKFRKRAKIIGTKMEYGHWHNSANAREFFDEYAQTAGFDPLVPDNWYPITFSALRNAGGGSLLNAYGFNLKKALSRAYPEVDFQEQFRTKKKIGSL